MLPAPLLSSDPLSRGFAREDPATLRDPRRLLCGENTHLAGNPYVDRKTAKAACLRTIFFGGITRCPVVWKAFRASFPGRAQTMSKSSSRHHSHLYRVSNGQQIRKTRR